MSQTVPHPGVAENLIEHELGCGVFQWLLVALVYWLPAIPIVLTVQNMVFGSYNPGWTCLDNSSQYTQLNTSLDMNSNTSSNNVIDTKIKSHILFDESTALETVDKNSTCASFKTCGNLKFNSDTSTIVSEWGLVCDEDHIPSLIISIQMVGMFVGALVAGSAADILGRKITFYGSLLVIAVFSCVSIFSVSWLMFAVLRFFLGFFSSGAISTHYLYTSEFLSMKWRGPFTGSPTWPISGIIFAIITMLLKNWKNLLILTCVFAFFCCLPALFFPESIRWLEVKNKSPRFRKAVKTITKVNKTGLPKYESREFLTQEKAEPSAEMNDKYIFLQLFRQGYASFTFIFAFVWFTLSIVFTSVTFGVRVLDGNFYTNFIILNALSLPFVIFSVFAPNAMGRKMAAITSCLWITLCSGGAIGFELLSEGKVKSIGILITLTFAVAGVECCQAMITLLMAEIYPTVVRGVSLSWGCLIIRFGAIIAPYLIPNESDTVYFWYLVMTILGFLSCCLLTWLPETKGKHLKETFGVKSKGEEC